MTTTINADNGVSSGSAGLKESADSSGILQLQTNGTAAVTVDTSQNVGIGTSSPSYKVEMAITSGSNFYSATTSATGQDIGYRLASTAASGREYRISTSDPTRGTYGAGLAFIDQTAGAARMLIDSSGNLLVGTTATNVTSGGYNFLINDGGTGYSTGYIGHSTGCPSGYAYLNFKYAGTSIGTITQNGTTAVAYNTSSDYRLKHDIAPMTSALAKVAALKPVTYKWNADNSDGEGFIAHELAEVCPHAVTGAKDAVDAEGNPVYQGIDTSFLVATLTAAIQELKALVDTQASTITALTARIEALEAK